jgi:hypothetical protein
VTDSDGYHGPARVGAPLARPDVLDLIDQLVGSVLVACPLRDSGGTVADFTIEHLSPGYVDPAGRPAAELAGRSLLAAYPGSGGWLFTLAAEVLTSGTGKHVAGPVGGLLSGSRQAVEVTDLRATAVDEEVIITWQHATPPGDAPRDLSRLVPRPASDAGLATRVRRALVPPDRELMAKAGVDIAVRYRPADGGKKEVSGDWYDVLPLADGDILLVVGDIAGHGEAAVKEMDRAREALRALVSAGATPGGLLSELNDAAIRFTEGSTGTVICGRYHPRARVLRWARAGHLPPVLVRDGVAAPLELPEGLLLGVDPNAAYEEATLDLQPGDTLLLYTDGLVERRADSISDSLAEFAASAVPAGPDVDAHAARIMASAASDTGDDACLLAIRVR